MSRAFPSADQSNNLSNTANTTQKFEIFKKGRGIFGTAGHFSVKNGLV